MTTQSAERVGNWSLMHPFCLVTQRSFPLRGETKIAVMKSDCLAMLFKGDMLWIQNYHYSFGGIHSLLGYHEY